MNFETTENGSVAGTQWNPNPIAATATAAKPASTRTRSKAADELGEKLAAEMKAFNDVATELRAKRNASLPPVARRKQVVETATELFGVSPTWTAFYREILGANGIVRALFEDAQSMTDYEASEEHAKILEMLTVLRSQDLPENDPHEPQRMITVRIPKSLHDSICDEANALEVSVNKLCISKLLQRIDLSMIPTSSQKRRGRRPGSAGTPKVEVADSVRPVAQSE